MHRPTLILLIASQVQLLHALSQSRSQFLSSCSFLVTSAVSIVADPLECNAFGGEKMSETKTPRYIEEEVEFVYGENKGMSARIDNRHFVPAL